MCILSSNELTVEIAAHGAEIVSVKGKDGREYIWKGDKAIWGRHAPVLFPIVGKVKGDCYTADGKQYKMTQHGIARDLEFSAEKISEEKALFVLESSDKTKEKYPYDFRLEIGYELCENKICVSWKVINTDKRAIDFSIGAHPAFVGKRDNLVGSKLIFDTKSDALEYGILTDTGLMSGKTATLNLTEKKATITEDFFDKDALVFEHSDCKSVSLTDGDDMIVRVDFDAPLFGIWSAKGKGVPYICIEPWYGRTDAENFKGSFAEREYSNHLEKGEEFFASYTMIFGNKK